MEQRSWIEIDDLVKLFYTSIFGKLQPPNPQSVEASACACVLNPNDKKIHYGATP